MNDRDRYDRTVACRVCGEATENKAELAQHENL